MLITLQHPQARLRDLRLPEPPPGGVEAWCHLIGEERGRPIRIRYRPAAELAAVVGLVADTGLGPCGLWLATADADYIVADESAPAMLREHTILHELAHLLLRHTGTTVEPEQEYEAETLADVLAQMRPSSPRKNWIRRVISGPSRKRPSAHSMTR